MILNNNLPTIQLKTYCLVTKYSDMEKAQQLSLAAVLRPLWRWNSLPAMRIGWLFLLWLFISFHQSLSVFINLYQYFSVFISLYQSLSVFVSVYQSLSVFISLYRSLSVFISLYQYLSVFINLYQCLSVLHQNYVGNIFHHWREGAEGAEIISP